jgi:hypothetical protein
VDLKKDDRCLGVRAVEWQFGLKHLVFVLSYSRWSHARMTYRSLPQCYSLRRRETNVRKRLSWWQRNDDDVLSLVIPLHSIALTIGRLMLETLRCDMDNVEGKTEL